MTADHILSQHGNVIAADFRPRPSLGLTVELQTETLYRDGHVILLRTVGTFGGKAFLVSHTLGDLATGTTVNL